MPRSSLVFLALALAALPSCGAAPAPATADDVASQGAPVETPTAPPSGGEAEAAGAPADAPAAEEKAGASNDAPESESEALARDFLKSGGRRIGYSATKKGFAYPYEQRREDGFRLDILFTDDSGQRRDILQVCDYSACAEKLDEIAKDMIPKLASRLEGDGYAGIRSIGWPTNHNELEVSTLGMKLRYSKGRLEGLREGKPVVALGTLGASVPEPPELVAIFIVPDTKKLAAFVKGQGGVVQELRVVKLP